MTYFLTIAIFQLNKQSVLVHEVIKVGYDVVMLEDGEDAYLIHHISALLVGQAVQIHLLPYHQRVVLGKSQGVNKLHYRGDYPKRYLIQ